MPYVDHAEGRTFFENRGQKTSRPALIYLHGGPGGVHYHLRPLFELAKDRQVYLYTQVGGGKSGSLPPKKVKIQTFVNELENLVNAWKLEDFHLAGGSWGTTLALEYYLRTKDKRLRSLIFQSPMFSTKIWEKDAAKLIKGLSDNDQKILRYCHEIGATDSKVYKEVMIKYYLKHVIRNKRKLNELMGGKNPNGSQIYRKMWGPSEFYSSGTLKNYDRIKDLKKVRVPTLLLAGEHDEATPTSTKRFSKLIPGAQVEIIKGAAHMISQERPKQLNSAISKFMQQVEKEF